METFKRFGIFYKDMSAEVVLCDDIKNIYNNEFGIKWEHVLEKR
jgi:hypothetical protein